MKPAESMPFKRQPARIAAALALTAFSLAACRGPQSMLDAAGPAAETGVQITWVLVVGAAMIWVLMLALLALAMRPRGHAPLQRPDRVIVAGGLAFPTAVLVALLVYGTVAGRRIVAADAEVDLVVEVTGLRWQWRFDYLDPAGEVVARSIDRLALPLGGMVEFRVGSDDVIHSFWIPRLGGKIDAIPGRINVIRLQADRAGAMSGQCAEFCGRDHAHMRFAVDVMEGADFARWIAAHPTDGATPGARGRQP